MRGEAINLRRDVACTRNPQAGSSHIQSKHLDARDAQHPVTLPSRRARAAARLNAQNLQIQHAVMLRFAGGIGAS